MVDLGTNNIFNDQLNINSRKVWIQLQYRRLFEAKFDILKRLGRSDEQKLLVAPTGFPSSMLQCFAAISRNKKSTGSPRHQIPIYHWAAAQVLAECCWTRFHLNLLSLMKQC